jgi:hypothetical protein
LRAAGADAGVTCNEVEHRTASVPKVGAWFGIRSRLDESMKKMPPSAGFVVTGNDTALAAIIFVAR